MRKGGAAGLHDNRVRLCLEALADIMLIVDASARDMFLSPGDVHKIQSLTDVYLQSYSRLATSADEAKEHLWSSVPKLHWMWHWAHRCQYLSPRKGACLLDEDFVGKIKAIVAASMRAQTAHMAGKAVVTRAQWGKHMMFAHRQP